MAINAIIIFLTAMLSGLAVIFIPNIRMRNFSLVLNFSGAYLFSMTVIHILPELFTDAENITQTGIFVLTGFFFQMILEYFTTGIEHGHIHLHTPHDHAHEHGTLPFMLVVSMWIHAFLEGTLLVHPTSAHSHDETSQVLLGLMLHKIPEAFALMSVLVMALGKGVKSYALLLIFALASPVGLFLSHLFYDSSTFDSRIFNMLFAVVAGNFLYISTTILFETSPEHKFKANKLMISLLGAFLAILAQVFFH